MRFALIDAEKAEFPVRTMCRVLDVSRERVLFMERAACQSASAGRYDLSEFSYSASPSSYRTRTYGSPRMHRPILWMRACP